MDTTNRRILIAGVGNIFLGDDAFGVEVAQRLAQRKQPDGVRVVDFGIRGLDLTYALLDSCDVAIIVDASPRGHAPGTLYVIQPDPLESADSVVPLPPGDLLIETHGMDPAKVLRLVGAMGSQLRHILVVGCEPTPIESEEDMQMELSEPVRAAIEPAVELVESLVKQIHRGEYEPFKDQSPAVCSVGPALKGESSHGHHDATV